MSNFEGCVSVSKRFKAAALSGARDSGSLKLHHFSLENAQLIHTKRTHTITYSVDLKSPFRCLFHPLGHMWRESLVKLEREYPDNLLVCHSCWRLNLLRMLYAFPNICHFCAFSVSFLNRIAGWLVAKSYSLPYNEPLLLAPGRPSFHTASENNLDTSHSGATGFFTSDQACNHQTYVFI